MDALPLFDHCPIQISNHNPLTHRLGTILAAGVWSGPLLSAVTGDARWSRLLQPRRGHLLELQRPEVMPPIRRGMMEMSYTKHYTTAGDAGSDEIDITFTATTSASGSLLVCAWVNLMVYKVICLTHMCERACLTVQVGSSREFSGWASEPSSSIIDAIMARAGHFLPALAASVPAGPLGSDVRVGLRPFALGGLPLIGPIQASLPGIIVAAGHEGSGLCLGPTTAQLAVQYLLGYGELPIEKFVDFLPMNRASFETQS